MDLELEANDKAEGDKEPTETAGDEPLFNSGEVELLRQIIKPPTGDQPSTAPKSRKKQGSTHLDSGSDSSDSSVEDLDASRGTRTKKKGAMPTKTSHPSQWSDKDIDIVCQIRYKTDLQRFQNYRHNKINLKDVPCINTKDHSAYIEVAQVDPGSVIRKSVFSVAAYRESL